MCPNFFLGQTNDFTAPFTEFGMLVTCNFEKVKVMLAEEEKKLSEQEKKCSRLIKDRDRRIEDFLKQADL